jgi:hypothetical protein
MIKIHRKYISFDQKQIKHFFISTVLCSCLFDLFFSIILTVKKKINNIQLKYYCIWLFVVRFLFCFISIKTIHTNIQRHTMTKKKHERNTSGRNILRGRVFFYLFRIIKIFLYRIIRKKNENSIISFLLLFFI